MNQLFRDSGTAFVLSEATDKPAHFSFKHSDQRTLAAAFMARSEGIRFFFEDQRNTANARIYITCPSSQRNLDDPYNLDGKTFGIAYNDDSTTAAALTADENQNHPSERA